MAEIPPKEVRSYFDCKSVAGSTVPTNELPSEILRGYLLWKKETRKVPDGNPGDGLLRKRYIGLPITYRL